MSKTSLQAIFAAAGLAFSGFVTPDAVAFASALQKQNTDALMNFAVQYPDSAYAADAIQLAQSVFCFDQFGQLGKRTNSGGCAVDTTRGGRDNGNQDNNSYGSGT